MKYRRIRDLREDRDLTQTEMGRVLSCSQRVYSNYERGELDIPTEILIKLADFHGVSADYILNRTDVKECADVFTKAVPLSAKNAPVNELNNQ